MINEVHRSLGRFVYLTTGRARSKQGNLRHDTYINIILVIHNESSPIVSVCRTSGNCPSGPGFHPRPLDYQHPPEIHSELRYASVESPPPQSKPLLSSRQRTTRKPRKRGTTAAPTSIATVATTTKKSPTTSGVLSNNPARMNPTDSMPRSVVSDAVRKRRVEQLERQFQQSPILPTGLTTRQTVEVTTTQDFSTTSPKKRSSTGLTRDEEITYSYQIRSLRTVMRLRKQVSSSTSNNSINHGGDISEGSWAKACGTSVHELRKIIRDGRAAREAVVNANIGLVTSLAKKQYSALKQATAQGGGWNDPNATRYDTRWNSGSDGSSRAIRAREGIPIQYLCNMVD